MGSIVVVSGPIGAGKTTVAKALVEASPPPVSLIEGDAFWPFITKPLTPGPRANFQTLMRAMVRASAAIAADGFEVILDFSMPPAFLQRAAERLEKSQIHFVVLRPSLEVCAARAAARPEGAIVDYGPYRDFYAMFDVDERHVVADEIPPEQAASLIREGLKAGRFRFG